MILRLNIDLIKRRSYMERSYIFLIVTILTLVVETYLSLLLIKKSKEDDPKFALSPA